MGVCRHIASAIFAYVTCGSLLLILLSCELMRQRLLKWLVISYKICNKGIHQHLIFFRLWFSCLLFVSTLIARSTLSISQIYSWQISNSNPKLNCLRRFCEWVSLPVVILILRFSLNRASARKSRYGFYYLLVFSYLLRMRTTISELARDPPYFLACYSLGIDIFSRPWNLVGCLMFSYDFYLSQFRWLYTCTWNAGFLCSVNERQLLMTWLCVCVIKVPITVLPFLPWIVQWFREHLSRQERMESENRPVRKIP